VTLNVTSYLSKGFYLWIISIDIKLLNVRYVLGIDIATENINSRPRTTDPMAAQSEGMTGRKHKEISPLGRRVEAFSLNLLHLIRGVRVYPSKHPTLLEVARDVLNSVPLDSMGSLAIGVTSRELIVSGEFVGGKASTLASLLHARKVLQLLWTRDATLDDAWTFARVMSTPKLEGEELREKLRSEVFTIDVEPLNLAQIHSKITNTVKDPAEDREQRRRRAWLALMSDEAPVEQLASALGCEEFWDAAKDEWTRSGLGDSEGFAQFLLKLGERLEEALAYLPPGQREEILAYLTHMGKCLAVKDLVRVVGREDQESKRLGLGKASLLKGINVERFVDLLAGLASMGEQGTRRFMEVYRRFAPVTESRDILSLVRSRISQAKDSGYSADVWKTVETLILNLTENPFMDPEHSESLEFLMNPSASTSPDEDITVLPEVPDQHLDRLFLALAAEEEKDFEKKLVDRVKLRAKQLGPFGVLEFLRSVDRTLPRLLDANPYFVREVFEKGIRALAKATSADRQALIHFAVTHEKCLLDAALKALIEEKEVTTRYFLVNLLSCFSIAATPAFVSRSRIGPWYVTRNFVIVLGQQGFSLVLPHLRSLSNHAHPKVKREALKALNRVQALTANPSTGQAGEAVALQNSEDSGIG
jgi:hypothetical protein